MLITMESTEEGERRIYCSLHNSVVSWFSDDGEGGVMLSAQRGEFACPWSNTEGKIQAVKESVLQEVARRLDCDPAEVPCHSMVELAKICTPHLKHRNHWVGRSRSKRPFVR